MNQERYKKIIHAHKDFLNDYLYWIRLASFTDTLYRAEYYDIVWTTYRLLREVRLTTLPGYCNPADPKKPKQDSLAVSDPDCPMPVGVEIPFVVGKIQFDCKSWGIEAGELIVINVDHVIGGATTIAFGVGENLFTVPEVKGPPLQISGGVSETIKGQVYVTLDAGTVVDWGLLFEAEIDIKGAGKPLEIKQNVTLSVNKGLTAEGVLTDMVDKYYEIPKETQVNKNVPIYKPQ
jgi:hypothetical protein